MNDFMLFKANIGRRAEYVYAPSMYIALVGEETLDVLSYQI